MLAAMRTTVTLDPDVERMLATAVRERGISFKQALNEAVRSGVRETPSRRRRFVQKTCAMGWDPLSLGQSARAFRRDRRRRVDS
jgi:hypothetical protein